MKRILALLLVALFALGLFFLPKKNKLEVQPWMSEQIAEDLSYFDANEFQSNALKAYFKRSRTKDLLVFYQIKDNTVYWTKNWEGKKSIDRVRKTTQILNRMTRKRKLPDVEFILSVHDGWKSSDETDKDYLIKDLDDDYIDDGIARPIFSYAKAEGGDSVLFPDPLSEAFSRNSRKSIVRSNLRLKYRWGKKENIAFWRGGTTGTRGFRKETWFLNPRTKLSMLSKYYPELVDAGYTSFPGVKEDVQHEINNILPTMNWVTHKNHLKYKYLVIPDGNTCTYPRYYLGLSSNSVVFKQNSSQVQWFYRGLKPFVHYVPVAKDFSDLPERVQWARNHDREVKKISKNARAFVRKNLMPKHIHDYVETLLNEYAKKQHSQIVLLEDAEQYQSLKEMK